MGWSAGIAAVFVAGILAVAAPFVWATEGHFYDPVAGMSGSSPDRWQRDAMPGFAALEEKQFERAIHFFTRALQTTPRPAVAARLYDARGDAHAGNGDYERARTDYARAAAQINLKTADDFSNRAFLHEKRGDFSAAAADLAEAVKRWPKNSAVLNDLAWFRATAPAAGVRNGQEAVRLSQHACEMRNWKSADLIDTLAAAYAETGNFDAAIKHQTQAVAMTSRFHESRKGKEERLALYQKRKPYRQEPKLKSGR